jgi:EAL domain-containing protein (putative c-di-GMP-specific phosphodiesterase class I)
MPLQQLVEYFNDRFEQEHHSSFRPFVLDGKQVSGLFGPIKINTFFTPLRQLQKPSVITGYAAKLQVSTYEIQHLYANDIENLLINNRAPGNDFDSIINFDRLCRTVHMLNYLPFAHLDDLLFLEVDPRHILGVKHDHGAYFQEVINRCGLTAKQVVIVVSINLPNLAYVQVLIEGLNNYRRHGYQIALKFDYVAQDDQIATLIENLAPDYVSLSAKYLDQLRDSSLPDKLQRIKKLVKDAGGRCILQQVDNKKSALLARNAGFDWVQGTYYEQTSASLPNVFLAQENVA